MKGISSFEILIVISMLMISLVFLLAGTGALKGQLAGKAEEQAGQLAALRLAAKIDSLAPLCAYSCYATYSIPKDFDDVKIESNGVTLLKAGKTYNASLVHPIDPANANATNASSAWIIIFSRGMQ